LCLISPWMENGNLPAFLAESKEFHPSHQILDVALGLRYLYDKDFVHSDLKAGYISVTPSFRACIADFGSSIITTISSRQLISSSQRAQGGKICATKHPNCTEENIIIYTRIFMCSPASRTVRCT
ncbi:hypothetical protein B0H13DRAFT_1659071, partial [Mycena leptocephala]